MGKQLILDDNTRNRLAAEAYKDDISKEEIEKLIKNQSFGLLKIEYFFVCSVGT